ncbi:hypothetical protein [Paremcibacter congregatus]|uniref:Uncharacterized protein n=1 Tax=Paremcibacter congregatus TaxID=2043170 RepID=A0A2G4YRM9_9PROT|nr:hypothetical protein [Paremcibacter congregatus]PHZ85004.1 hypothetical protein CRD36_09805 [Paremcibacter congregatus]QDE26021.1 hypothetical protein FIV45_01340 [Paremcibacter congregatus]|tara:strand:- start:1030 stop:1269 length:240 start_codon:yes stop_codon:yes gene_type:complete
MSQEDDIASAMAYVTDVKFEYAAMINTLYYLCEEADSIGLPDVSLHLKIAIDELKAQGPRDASQDDEEITSIWPSAPTE